ncbi:MAG: type II toxin-antitoxin system HicA family toxin [Chloroflexota bacterium]
MPKVRDAIRLVESVGWYVKRTRGSHRTFGHPSRPGIVTIAGRPSKDLAAGTWRSILRQAGIEPRDE